MLKKLVLVIIKIYQATISPDHGQLRHILTYHRCRYYPSCSEYCYQAIAEKGLILGFICGMARILRCHPWAAGGYDPIKKG